MVKTIRVGRTKGEERVLCNGGQGLSFLFEQAGRRRCGCLLLASSRQPPPGRLRPESPNSEGFDGRKTVAKRKLLTRLDYHLCGGEPIVMCVGVQFRHSRQGQKGEKKKKKGTSEGVFPSSFMLTSVSSSVESLSMQNTPWTVNPSSQSRSCENEPIKSNLFFPILTLCAFSSLKRGVKGVVVCCDLPPGIAASSRRRREDYGLRSCARATSGPRWTRD